jgi:hypothetical protein
MYLRVKLMKTACVILALICLLPVSYGRKQQPPEAVPIIRLDKTRFALGESVFFWVGVERTGDAPIPKQYQESCRLLITRPDGTQKTKDVGWPTDGPKDSGWLGGSGLDEESVQPGRYRLIFEFAGRQTSPAFLSVEDVQILKQVKTTFALGHPVDDAAPLDVHYPTAETVTLSVRNGSNQTVRFPRPGGPGRHVSVSIRRVDGGYTNEFFYPDEQLNGENKSEAGSPSYDRFSWDVAGEVPTITLQPGKTFRQELSLQAAFDEAKKGLRLDAGEYRVTFSTELQMLIGAEDGQWAELSPVRIPVGSTVTCRVTR